MNIINDLPFYIVILAVFINILLGIFTKVDFTILMIRSIVVTVVFSVFGFILSEVLKKAAADEIDKKDEKDKNVAPEEVSGSTIDIQVPPIDETELLNYNSEEEFYQKNEEPYRNIVETDQNEEDFFEVNPAYLHKFSQEEQNE